MWTLPHPDPTAGEVLVEVEGASINGFDLSVAAGYVFDMIPHEFPVVLGRDLVGTVTAVGDGVDAHGAAVIGLAGIAAHDALDALDVRRGEILLVSGATGGVGSIAVQLAAAAGATVIATARPGDEAHYVGGLGATHTVDYTGDLVAAVEAIAPNGVDKALHAPGNPATLGQVLRPNAAVATTLGANAEQFGREDVTVKAIMAGAIADKLAKLLDQVAGGALRVNVEATVPLDRAREALKTFADGTLGKVLITR